ncbi:hypothetical protein Scep_025974 [Stephania cephalantha]|uniref:Uncharacterized protein n=1 Tax=Stephania cephalantha TaxID=152367 RepID=A0AAP0ELR7_9MAGN
MTSLKSIEKYMHAMDMNNRESHEKYEKEMEGVKQAMKRTDDEISQFIKNLERQIGQLTSAWNLQKKE